MAPSDPNEMLDELGDHVFVVRSWIGQLHRDLQHVLAEEGHPGGAVGLLQMAAGGQGRTAVKDADVVQPEETRPQRRSCRTGLCGSPTR